MITVHFRVFDPPAKGANKAIFSLGPVLGINVSNPKLVKACKLGNIMSIESLVDIQLPSIGTLVLATETIDLKTVVIMAMIAIRAWREDDHARFHEAFGYDDCNFASANGNMLFREEQTKVDRLLEKTEEYSSESKSLGERVEKMRHWICS